MHPSITFTLTCCPVSNPASRSHFPERVRLGVFLFAPCGRYPTIIVRSVFAAGKSWVECGLAIINSLIVGEVRRSVCVPAHQSVVQLRRLKWPHVNRVARKKSKGGGQSPQFKMHIDPALKGQLYAVVAEEGVCLASWSKALAREALRSKGLESKG